MNRQRWAAAAAVAVAFVVAGLVWFRPWALWVDKTVDEALPSAAPRTAPAGEPSPRVPAAPVTVAHGTFISHEHATSGAVKIVRLADGSHTLRFEGLETSNGPDLRVRLSDAPVKEGRAGWFVFDEGTYVNLAKLKGNKGDQNYQLPADLDWSAYTSVSIWCDRFDVSFGAASLVRT
ncbi:MULTISPECIES: DM13 domain-containing protein [unclassified Streptomyces]|uniref:DM13 domain-containing protein n=1 Tax=unclassified Streptomyces TaxID=2593676 RepID=UPI001E573778|nr:DM13 domain-containing protein [Streptomyces sp. MBT42]MCD2462544.1 DM13 domain-containing protein [Streptomyces sp. MBT42]